MAGLDEVSQVAVESTRDPASGMHAPALGRVSPSSRRSSAATSPGLPPKHRDGYSLRKNERVLEYAEVLAAKPVPPSARDSTRRLLLVLTDVASFAGALAITGFVAPLARSGYLLVAMLGLFVLLNKLLGLYDWDSAVVDKSTIHELPKLAQSVLIAVVAILTLGLAFGLAVHRNGALEFAAVVLVVLSVTRSLVRMFVLRLCGPERALIIGSGKLAQLLSRKLETYPSCGTQIVGYVDVGATDHRGDGLPPPLGDLSCTHELCRDLDIERLIVASSMLDDEHLLDAVRPVKGLGVRVTVVPPVFEALYSLATVDDLEGMSVLSLRGPTRTRVSLALKRAIDIIGAAVGLVALCPLLALIALAIKLDSGGSVIFSQVRIGRANKPFRIRKFRTMVEDAEQFKAEIAHLNEVEYPLLKIPEDRDPRLTRIGRVLRRTMLDELPQFWNVLLGEMSLVGPRPLEPQDDAEVIGWHRARLELTPGLTGPWQAMGRHAIPFRDMLTLDCLYVADWSLWHDIKLMIRTVQVVLSHRS